MRKLWNEFRRYLFLRSHDVNYFKRGVTSRFFTVNFCLPLCMHWFGWFGFHPVWLCLLSLCSKCILTISRSSAVSSRWSKLDILCHWSKVVETYCPLRLRNISGVACLWMGMMVCKLLRLTNPVQGRRTKKQPGDVSLQVLLKIRSEI